MALWPPSSLLVKQSLAAHSQVGLVMAALLYLICLSGALAVLYPDLARWEDPTAPELASYPPQLVDQALAELPVTDAERPEHIDLVLPTAAFPRMALIAEERQWWVAADGQLVAKQEPVWSRFLLDLHIYLHLPKTLGLTLVGISGVLLLGLIVSGILTHPRLVRDAFRWRWGAGGRERQLDLHNRLSVWGLPFYLVIALTGGYFGLSTLMLGATAALLYDGDQQRVIQPFLAQLPEADPQSAPLPAVAPLLAELARRQPGAIPFYLELERPFTAGQVVTISATLPGRLIYAENFQFDGRGQWLGPHGMADGELGRQLFASTYPLHFGSYGGLPVRLLYLLLGLALCLITNSGLCLWLARRRDRGQPLPLLERWWTTLIWASPLLLAVTMVVAPWVEGRLLVALFWAGLALLSVATPWLPQPERWRGWLQFALVASGLLVVAMAVARHGWTAAITGGLTINLLLLAALLLLLVSRWRQWFRGAAGPG